MKENIIDIKAESYSWQVKLLGGVLLFIAFAVMMNQWWLSIILAVAGIVLLFGYSGTEIDPLAKTFREYNSFFFVRRGGLERYKEIEKIYVNRARGSEKMYTAHTLKSSTFQFNIYNAYLKFGDGRKIFLTSRKDKAKLMKLLNSSFAANGVEITDNTIYT